MKERAGNAVDSVNSAGAAAAATADMEHHNNRSVVVCEQEQKQKKEKCRVEFQTFVHLLNLDNMNF